MNIKLTIVKKILKRMFTNNKIELRYQKILFLHAFLYLAKL
jgi:hypothetical protein